MSLGGGGYRRILRELDFLAESDQLVSVLKYIYIYIYGEVPGHSRSLLYLLTRSITFSHPTLFTNTLSLPFQHSPIPSLTHLYLPTPSLTFPHPLLPFHTLLYIPTPSPTFPHPLLLVQTLPYLPTSSHNFPHPPLYYYILPYFPNSHTLLYLPTSSHSFPHPSPPSTPF